MFVFFSHSVPRVYVNKWIAKLLQSIFNDATRGFYSFLGFYSSFIRGRLLLDSLLSNLADQKGETLHEVSLGSFLIANATLFTVHKDNHNLNHHRQCLRFSLQKSEKRGSWGTNSHLIRFRLEMGKLSS